MKEQPRVETVEEFRLCLELGFEYFQGFYFARPAILSGMQIAPSELDILHFLELVNSEADNHTIELAVKREQQLVHRAIVERGARMLRQLESVATTDRAMQAIREQYDPQWVAEHLGRWLQNYFDHDLIVIVDGTDRIAYARSRVAGDTGLPQLPPELEAILNFVRGRIDAMPAGVLPVIAPPDAGNPNGAAPR